MKYVNETVRLQDNLLSEERALQLIRDSEYGVLSIDRKSTRLNSSHDV